jgi:cbb3-type cytochrome oxidase maturation protein
MSILFVLIPVTFCLGLAGLFAFLWSLRSGQYEDLSGAAERVLFEEDAPARQRRRGADASTLDTTDRGTPWSQT